MLPVADDSLLGLGMEAFGGGDTNEGTLLIKLLLLISFILNVIFWVRLRQYNPLDSEAELMDRINFLSQSRVP
jgi:tRNA A37 methylthiotransferase MiaB